jgi:predicted enzyme related to lactoylglutathione lyase
MTMEVLFVGVPVPDLSVASEWYSRLFGRAADIVPNETEVMWRVTDGGWLYVIEDPERSGRSLVAISVDDLERSATELLERGIPIGAIETVGDAARKATIVDPAGNSIAFIEVSQ